MKTSERLPGMDNAVSSEKGYIDGSTMFTNPDSVVDDRIGGTGSIIGSSVADTGQRVGIGRKGNWQLASSPCAFYTLELVL